MPFNTRAHRLTLLVATLLSALYLLLILDRAHIHSRVIFALWNIAHVPLFFVLTLVIDRTLLRHSPKTVGAWLILLLPPLILFAIGTELLQAFTERDPSARDVIMNLSGVALGLFVLWHKRYAAPHRHWIINGIAAALLLALFIKPAQMMVADFHRSRVFPVLSDFEHWSDPYNWSYGERSTEVAKEGKYSLKVILPAEPYSGASLRYFPSQWHDYNQLHVAIFNPEKTSLPLSLRVHDRLHRELGQAYSDRYNLNFEAQPGWNTIRVPLQKIAHAAQNRIISLDEINTVRIFYQGTPKAGAYFYIDELRLEK